MGGWPMLSDEGADNGQLPEPIITIGMVGVVLPCSGSIVIAKALASTSIGSGGFMTVAPPRASGLNTPAGMGAPCIGMSQSWYAFPGGRGSKLVAMKMRPARCREYMALLSGGAFL